MRDKMVEEKAKHAQECLILQDEWRDKLMRKKSKHERIVSDMKS